MPATPCQDTCSLKENFNNSWEAPQVVQIQGGCIFLGEARPKVDKQLAFTKISVSVVYQIGGEINLHEKGSLACLKEYNNLHLEECWLKGGEMMVKNKLKISLIVHNICYS